MSETADPSVAGLILAAGSSARMGQPKQLLSFRGRPLLQHVIDSMRAGGIEETVLVLGHRADDILAALRLPTKTRVVVNPDHRRGQASSLRAGLKAYAGDVRAAMVLLGDQPEVSPEIIRTVLNLYRRTGGPVVRAEYRGTPGHPVVLGREVWDAVSRLSGDTGARPALEQHPEWLVTCPVDRPAPTEVDTPEDYQSLTRDDG